MSEIKIDWSKVPVDTKIYIQTDSRTKEAYHFKDYSKTNKTVYFWNNGKTSHTFFNLHHVNVCPVEEKFVTLADAADIEKYRVKEEWVPFKTAEEILPHIKEPIQYNSGTRLKAWGVKDNGILAFGEIGIHVLTFEEAFILFTFANGTPFGKLKEVEQ